MSLQLSPPRSPFRPSWPGHIPLIPPIPAEEVTFETATGVAQRLLQWARDQGRDLVQLAIAWTLAHPAVTSAIVGAKTQDQVLHVARAADWELSQGDLHEIGDILGEFNLVDWDRQSE